MPNVLEMYSDSETDEEFYGGLTAGPSAAFQEVHLNEKDDDFLAVDQPLQDVDEEDHRTARHTLFVKSFVEELVERGFLAMRSAHRNPIFPCEAAALPPNVSKADLNKLHEEAVRTEAFPERITKFIVMDSEVSSVGKDDNGHMHPTEISFVGCAFNQDLGYWEVHPVMHMLINHGDSRVRSTVPYDDFDTFYFNVMHLHGLTGNYGNTYPTAKEDFVVVGQRGLQEEEEIDAAAAAYVARHSWGAAEVQDADADEDAEPASEPRRTYMTYAQAWKKIRSTVYNDYGNLVLMKGGRDEMQTMAWLRHQALEEEKLQPIPSKVTQMPFYFVDVMGASFETFLSRWGYSIAAERLGRLLLPVQQRHAKYGCGEVGAGVEAEAEGDDDECDEGGGSVPLLQGMSDEGWFEERSIPPQYFGAETVKHILKVHEALAWTDHSCLCSYHQEVETVFQDMAATGDVAQEVRDTRPFHVHCAKKDAYCLANGLACILSACDAASM